MSPKISPSYPTNKLLAYSSWEAIHHRDFLLVQNWDEKSNVLSIEFWHFFLRLPFLFYAEIKYSCVTFFYSWQAIKVSFDLSILLAICLYLNIGKSFCNEKAVEYMNYYPNRAVISYHLFIYYVLSSIIFGSALFRWEQNINILNIETLR